MIETPGEDFDIRIESVLGTTPERAARCVDVCVCPSYKVLGVSHVPHHACVGDPVQEACHMIFVGSARFFLDPS